MYTYICMYIHVPLFIYIYIYICRFRRGSTVAGGLMMSMTMRVTERITTTVSMKFHQLVWNVLLQQKGPI